MTTHVFAVSEQQAWEASEILWLFARRKKAKAAAEEHARALAAEKGYTYVAQGSTGDWHIGPEKNKTVYSVFVSKMKVHA